MIRRFFHSTEKEEVTPTLPSSLYIEAENANTLDAGWSIVNEGSITAIHDITINTGSTDNQNAVYNFIVQSGVYRIWIKSRYLEAALRDTLHFKANGGLQLNCRTSATVDYSWWQVNDGYNISAPVNFTLNEGANTINIIDREVCAIDKIYITKNGDTPT